MKFHTWSELDDAALLKAIEDCQPLFEHFKTQGTSYSEANAWDAIAGRLLPSLCVTGAACRRRCEVIKQQEMHSRKEKSDFDAWKAAIDCVEKYEKDLAETTFDGVAEILGNIDALFGAVKKIQKDIDDLKRIWE